MDEKNGIKNFMFPIMKMPGENWIGHIHDLAAAMMRDGGSLKEIWVSRQIYDSLTLEIMDFEKNTRNPPQENKWKNGLIIINTASGRVKIRLDE